MRSSASRRCVRELVTVHRHQADGVSLLGHEIRERRGDDLAIAKLRDALLRKRHRRARVEREHHREVRRLAKLSGVESVAPREELPVEILEIVAGAVRAVLAEFGAVAMERTSVAACSK